MKHILILMVIFILSFGILSNAQEVKKTSDPLIALMTDYSDKDFYVGALKGVISSMSPEAKILDITHKITPYDINEGALTLLLAAREFPAGTIFIGIVDPGVGTDRKPIAVETNSGKIFIGPDNGLFTMVIDEFGLKNVYQITNKEWFRKGEVSYSFHGRDIFAPTAAHIAAGKPISECGVVIKDYVRLPIKKAVSENGKITAEIIFTDDYGNIQINAGWDMVEELGLKKGDSVTVSAKDKKVKCKLVNSYGDVPEGDFVFFKASTAFPEIAINMGSAKDKLAVKRGSSLEIEKVK